MSMRLPMYGGLLLLFVLVACDRTDVSVTNAPTALTASVTSSTFGFEPATLRPEFLPGRCGPGPLFGTRIIIVIRGGDVTLRGLRFRFTDMLGVTSLPRVMPIPSASPLTAPVSTLPTLPIPIPGIAPLPSTGPIPIPGTLQSLPFFLAFDCGVASEGTLVIFIDTDDDRGRTHTSELRARVGP
ncbi:MAG TPA: hypothetical protein VFK57_00420 [Vicinamibacterales bacterium]|nr:hypothetical protein [Vicinamibacterales bacterium]